MSQRNHPATGQRPLSLFSTGRGRPYPLRPFPKVEALLIDPDARTIRTVYLRATRTGLRTIFGTARVTHVDRPFLRAYGTDQDHEQVTNRAILPDARFSVSGKVLITGPNFSEIHPEVSADILSGTTFCHSDGHEPSRLNLGYSSKIFSK